MATSGVSRREDVGYSAFDPDRDLECRDDGEPVCRDDSSRETEPPPDVMFCTRPVQLPVADQIGLQHHWLKTSHVEAGLGPEDGSVPGDGKSALPFSMTRINDHTGQSLRGDAECVDVAGVDEACVEERLAVGQLAGRWTLTNNCQTFVSEVLADCAVRTPEDSPVELGAEGARAR